ncbi:DMT family transporter [Helicobacter anatolicus]|uniref:DMT family transporter n=1 Tax=Helicobacter anatolicus TaxID=2905874 RepID=UPI001E5C8398|nr:DMT family transporter [Helicobacter anatolicus]MCE3037941.1 DMT family transporter [Helicobacter anatolicus]
MQSLSFGIFYMFCASFFFAIMNAFVKVLSEDVPPLENLFFRSLFMVFFMSFIFFDKKKFILKKGGWGKLWTRAILGAIAMLALFYNISSISLSIATTFMQSTPLYTLFFAFLFLKEKISLQNIFATCIGFIGILFICNPFGEPMAFINIIMGIISGALSALALITLKTLKEYFSNNFIIFFFGLSTTLIGGVLLLLPDLDLIDNTWHQPKLQEWVLLFSMGLAGTLGQHFLTKAYMSAPAGIIAPIDYTRIIWGIIFGIYLGDAFPNIQTLTGIFLITFSGLLIALPIFIHDLRRLKNAKNL